MIESTWTERRQTPGRGRMNERTLLLVMRVWTSVNWVAGAALLLAAVAPNEPSLRRQLNR